MPPKIRNIVAWQQAEILMQPAYLRVIDNLRKQLDVCTWSANYEEIETPYPGYILRLQKENYDLTFNLWDLCYQVCFLNYQIPHSDLESNDVDIDTSLIDDDGEVNWELLEAKAVNIINDLFANLPKV